MWRSRCKFSLLFSLKENLNHYPKLLQMKLKFTLLSFILLINIVSKANDYYWVGGTGMWSDGMIDADSCTATVSAGADQTICGDSSITLAANATTGGNWTGGAGTFAPNRNAANAIYTR